MHRYKVREIAQQCGLSEATVDRVLNGRPGVRESTRAEVRQASRALRSGKNIRPVGEAGAAAPCQNELSFCWQKKKSN